ncbi:hypothetical protein [uncultured Victivallis sp.]|uniref:hypothetical protein n=1 Tax=uncultured Victivallis sp. TaxID=354118 RepID=UPI0025E3A30A|nr:hypothetical protein [uncultured Victivallis sp.]
MKCAAALWGTPALLLVAGCCWMLPPGTPPDGAIVTEEVPAARDLRGAENDLVTSLFAYTLQNCPGAAVAVEADEPLLPLARRVIERTGAISGIFFAPEGRYLLRARMERNLLRCSLTDSSTGATVWSESVAVAPETR